MGLASAPARGAPIRGAPRVFLSYYPGAVSGDSAAHPRTAPNRDRIMRAGLAMAIAATLLCLASAPAAALDLGEWVPGLKLSPFLSERVDYETNVFQTPSHA